MLIRNAQENDIPHIMEVWLNFMSYLREINPDYYPLSSNPTAFSDFLGESLARDERRICVAEHEGEILGFILAFIEGLPEWFGVEKIGLIRYLAVKEENQQKGIGQKLCDQIIQWFREKEIHRAELYVLTGIPASDFWEKQGFRKLMDRRFLLIQ